MQRAWRKGHSEKDAIRYAKISGDSKSAKFLKSEWICRLNDRKCNSMNRSGKPVETIYEMMSEILYQKILFHKLCQYHKFR